MTEIQMPRLSDTMEEGVIASWHKQAGDQVDRGDVLAEIETDKAIMELEAFDAGVLEKVLVAEGQTVPIGTPIGVLGDGSGASAQAATDPTDTAAGSASPEPEGAAAEPEPERGALTTSPEGSAEPAHRPKASPLARAVARDHGVDLNSVTGTGPGGRIIRADIEAAGTRAGSAEDVTAQDDRSESGPGAQRTNAVSHAASDEDSEEIPLSSIRKVTAKRLTESKQQAPHFYLTSAIDVTELVGFRETLNERLRVGDGPKVSVNDLVVKAVATALRADPSVNVSFGGDKLIQHKRVHLGVAVAIESGLVVPVIKDADRLSVSEIATQGRDLAGRAREGKLKPDEMSGGTFTISNLGMFGIEQFSAVINPPEAGILAVGATTDEVRVRDGEFVARKIMRVTLSADHRAVDGAIGAKFVQRLTALLEDPLRIIA